jgi:hypothetical protein
MKVWKRQASFGYDGCSPGHSSLSGLQSSLLFSFPVGDRPGLLRVSGERLSAKLGASVMRSRALINQKEKPYG